MTIVAIVEALVGAGATPEQILAAVRASAVADEEREAKRLENQRIRTQRYRDSKNALKNTMSQDVTLCNVTERDVTLRNVTPPFPPSPSPSPSLLPSPIPPTNHPPTPTPTPTHTPVPHQNAHTRGSICEKKSDEEKKAFFSEVSRVFQFATDLFPNLINRGNAEIQQWLNSGMDVDLDILPVIQSKIGKTVKGWGLFTDDIATAHKTRLSPMPEGRTHPPPNGSHQPQFVREIQASMDEGMRLYLEDLNAGKLD